MTTEEIKQYLSSYYYLYQKVDFLKEELRCLEILADGTQGINYDKQRVQKTPSLKAPFIRYIDKIQNKEKEIEAKVDELIALKVEIENTIALVDSPIVELVLTYRYINFFEWNDIAKKLNYAESYIYELHRKGLWIIKEKRT